MPRISEAVKQDHALINRAFRRLLVADPADRQPDNFIWVLNRYLMVEDLVVAPALDHHIANGGERHRRLSDDFDSMNTKLRHMQKYDPASASFESALQAIWVDLEPHIREETAGDLDMLEDSLSKADSETLGKKYDDIKELLQRPYGQNGTPDARTLTAILELPREELMVKIGIAGEC
ncbi:hypothetical protein BT67DRAFT_386116 [Trichocladium antarcticum]|uniref:Hemerythrin-like domain-containing protein n=1 Tax=Trichocladium antarcticum TaxID=1450529 RepID=A0AAN6ZBZ6_9PEZI|nr:hypothetical protein BT67DRAFT_386116 [Trichocladium antarcticum]